MLSQLLMVLMICCYLSSGYVDHVILPIDVNASGAGIGKYDGEPVLRRLLVDMGLCPGVLVGRAPLRRSQAERQGSSHPHRPPPE